MYLEDFCSISKEPNTFGNAQMSYAASILVVNFKIVKREWDSRQVEFHEVGVAHHKAVLVENMLIASAGTVGPCRPEMETSNQILMYPITKTTSPKDLLVQYIGSEKVIVTWKDTQIELKNKYIVEIKPNNVSRWEQSKITDSAKISIGVSDSDLQSEIKNGLDLKITSYPFFLPNCPGAESIETAISILPQDYINTTQTALHFSNSAAAVSVTWTQSPRSKLQILVRMVSSKKTSPWKVARIHSNSNIEITRKLLDKLNLYYTSKDSIQFKCIDTIDGCHIVENLSNPLSLSFLDVEETAGPAIEEELVFGSSPSKAQKTKPNRQNTSKDEIIDEQVVESNISPVSFPLKANSYHTKQNATSVGNSHDEIISDSVPVPSLPLKKQSRSLKGSIGTELDDSLKSPQNENPVKKSSEEYSESLPSKKQKIGHHASKTSNTTSVQSIQSLSMLESGEIHSESSLQHEGSLVHDQQAIGNPEYPFYFSLKFSDGFMIRWDEDGHYYMAYALYYEYLDNHWNLRVTYDNYGANYNETFDLSRSDQTSRFKIAGAKDHNRALDELSNIKAKSELTLEETKTLNLSKGLKIYVIRQNDCPFKINPIQQN